MCKWGTDKEIKLCSLMPISKREKIKVDACMAPLVQMLNDYGIKTLACCCGHGKTPFSYIRISSQNIELIPMGDEITIHLKFRYRGDKID